MPKTLMQSVISELQKERRRLEDELHRVAAALTAFVKASGALLCAPGPAIQVESGIA